VASSAAVRLDALTFVTVGVSVGVGGADPTRREGPELGVLFFDDAERAIAGEVAPESE
jgi:hypothetical protein